MAKTIIFCADGTCNGPGEADDDGIGKPATNVLKLFLNLAGTDSDDSIMLKNEQERPLQAADGSVAQVAKYLHGVGDSGNFLVKLLGGTVGFGLITRIVRGYTFISRNYRAGDQIFIIGFSRGAYTARALAGLINNQGLLDATKLNLTDKNQGYRYGAAAWYAFRKNTARTGWLDRLAAFVVDLPLFFTRPVAADQRVLPAPVRAVAVWDTVGSLGIPAYSLHAERIDPFQFADRALSANVQTGLQAIALDEQRGDFTPTFWDSDPRVSQYVFPGAHADVGGGYPVAGNESGLSDCSLHWMMEELAKLGVRFVDQPARGKPDPVGASHQPWTELPWTLLEKKLRVMQPGVMLSQCLRDRLAAKGIGVPPVRYLPTNLPTV
jgi:uncharacterized protein (DUF2235 family)